MKSCWLWRKTMRVPVGVTSFTKGSNVLFAANRCWATLRISKTSSSARVAPMRQF